MGLYMSAGDIDDKEEPATTLARLRRDNREFDEYLKWAWTIKPIRTFFIPFAAGASYDGKSVYISYDVQTVIDNVEYESAIVRHETTEWALRYYLGIGEDYGDDPVGHRIANRAEFDRVRQLGDGDHALEVYKEVIDAQIYRTERMDITGRPIPQDLALYPYEDDTSLRSKMREEMFNERSEEEWNKLHPTTPTRTGPISPEPGDDPRLTRDIFIYLDPKAPQDRFAQCSTCRLWSNPDRCAVHGPDVEVTGSMSCALYVHGDPHSQLLEAAVTPIESGLVDREVRCENCQWFSETYCELFDRLNRGMPHEFNLDTKVHPKGCCNAQQPTEAD